MEKYTVDFSKVKYYIEIHEVLKRDLDFPDYYGGNTDALWDCLTDMLGDPSYIELFAFEEVQKNIKVSGTVSSEFSKKLSMHTMISTQIHLS